VDRGKIARRAVFEPEKARLKWLEIPSERLTTSRATGTLPQVARDDAFELLDEVPAFLTLVEGPELRVTMVNRLVREQPAGEVALGKPAREIYPGDNPVVATLERVYSTGIAETIHGIPPYFPDGAHASRYFTRHFSPLRDESGEVNRVLVLAYEVTEEVRARGAREALESQARDLEVARGQAVEASKAKDEFLAMVGHELRNPLAPMATILATMRLRGMTQSDLEILERQVHHLTRLVDDLLDVSRIARGMVELRQENVDLGTVVIQALEMTNPLISQRLHQVVTSLAPVVVRGDADRLAQVVANLITNAAKYSNFGSRIWIGTQRSGAMARLTVTDEGVGISPDMIGKVFETFVQEPQMLARTQGGLGLGLSIVKSLIGAHHGTVAAHSDGPGKGSTFVIELPAIEDANADVDAESATQRHPTSTPPMRILVVDDNYDAALALQGALEELGHVVAIAHDGPSALAEAVAFKPHVGLLDIGLPVMNGYELATAMRALRPVRLVAISGYGREHDRQRSDAAGFESHLVKPVYLDDLVPLLDRLGAGELPSSP
jgi:signal transduction histidine kinase